MQSSSKQEQLHQLLTAQYTSLQQTFPKRYDALLALVSASNNQYLEAQQNSTEYNITGLQKALSLCFSTANIHVDMPVEALDTWANATLQACSRLAEGERILAYIDSGFLRVQQGNDTDYNIWIAGKRMPTEEREQRDLAEWTDLLKQKYANEWAALDAERATIQQQLTSFVANEQASPLYTTTRTIDDYYSRLGMLHVKCMVASTTYPPNTAIGGCTFAVYCDVLGMLIGLTLKQMDACLLREGCASGRGPDMSSHGPISCLDNGGTCASSYSS